MIGKSPACLRWSNVLDRADVNVGAIILKPDPVTQSTGYRSEYRSVVRRSLIPGKRTAANHAPIVLQVTPMNMLKRRSFMIGSTIAASALACPALVKAAEPLTILGPTAAPSAVIIHALKSGLLKNVVPEAGFKVWKTPDEMRAAVASGSADAVIMPCYAAANLHNRGLDLGLLNILTVGVLYIVSKDGELKTIDGLKGKTIAVPFRNDMPDLVLTKLVAQAGLSADITFQYVATPPEAAQLLLTGRVDAALLTEPAVTGVISKAGSLFITIHRSIDVQKEWVKVAGRDRIPQAGLALTGKLADKLGANGLEAFQNGIEQALTEAMNAPAAAARDAASVLDFPQDIIASSFSTSQLVAARAREIRPELEEFYGILAQSNPAIIGGKMPGDGFYLI